MNVRLKQILWCLVLNGFVLFASSLVRAQEPQTFFDECLRTLENNNHYMFTADDAAKFKGDLRYQRFCDEYKRYVEVKEVTQHDIPQKVFARDTASASMCNAFVRWAALKSLGEDVGTCSRAQLSSVIVHTNYLLRLFGAQDLRKNGFSPDVDLNKMSELMKLQFDVQQELAARHEASPTLALKTVTDPQSATWILGDTYENITSVQWDSSGKYLICLATKNEVQSVLIFSFTASELKLSKEVEIAVSYDEIPDFKATYVVWGASFQTFILGGNARNGKKAAALLYVYNPVAQTATYHSTIHKTPSLFGVAHQAFWSSDFSRLCVVHAGECFVFVWHAEGFRFELAERIYPGFKKVNTASLSFDLSCYLTSHSDYPYIRLTKRNAPVGAYSVAHFKDRLCDAQWNPQYFYFIARSLVEPNLLVLFAYNPQTEGILLIQRIQVGSRISSMKWSADGLYLFVTCDPSLYSGVGLRAYAFNDGVLSVADSVDANAGGVCTVRDCAYSDAQKMLVIGGIAQNVINGSVLCFPPKNEKQGLSSRSVSKAPVVPPSLTIQSRSFEGNDQVYHFLADVPNPRHVGFGSLVMLVDPLRPTIALASCDAPEIRSVHNGKAFPCVRTIKSGDFSGEFLSAWWLVEGESWTERLNAPVKPVARMRLRNLATGECLGVSRESAPVYDVSSDPHVTLADSSEFFLNIRRPQDALSPWLIGEGVHLVANDFALGVDTVQPTNHPILNNLGFSKLVAEPAAALEAKGGFAHGFWAVARNLSLTTVLAQSSLGSECCGLLHKRLKNILSADDLGAVERAVSPSVC